MLTGHMVPERIARGIETYRSHLRAVFGPRLRRVSLFGSWARGDAHTDSDIDVLVLIDNATLTDERAAASLVADVALETEIWLSPVICSTEHFDHLVRIENPFARSVLREERAL